MDKTKIPYSIEAAELSALGPDRIPEQLVSSRHLIYSSPATLAFNSPGAQGFGVKRAGLAIPGSVMLLAAPGCCGRNTTILSELGGYSERFFYLMMDETDIVTGRHLKKIPEAVEQVCASLAKRPSVVMICITCVDALLGTDMERMCTKASERVGLPVLPCYMYALTREGRKPPMVHVRQSLYSLLEKRERKSTSVNILGYFAPLVQDCEIYDLLGQMGVRQIREISRCKDYGEYLAMAEANFNLVLHPEARYAAEDLRKRLDIPYIELRRLYQIDRVHRQYELFAAALGTRIDDREVYDRTRRLVEDFRERYPGLTFAVGEGCNANAFELSLALLRYGFAVAEIFASPSKEDYIYIHKIAALSPKTRFYSNLEPTMIYYDLKASPADLAVGKDAVYYHPETAGIEWSDDIAPFGYAGIRHFFEACQEALQAQESSKTGQFVPAAVQEGTTFSMEDQADLSGTVSHQSSSEKENGENGKEKRLEIRETAGERKESEEPLLPMKGLRIRIPPFAPDQSGAAAVFCELGGLTVILDAGGCAGNICGFDEPRWFGSRSAIFSAGLRDMDAILGRDDRLVEKIASATEQIAGSHVAVIGTPVPAVIATDYRAIGRMIRKRTGLPVITVETDGTRLYDRGASLAWKKLFETFARKGNAACAKKRIGLLGASPLEFGSSTVDSREMKACLERLFSRMELPEGLRADLQRFGDGNPGRSWMIYGMGHGLDRVEEAGDNLFNVVLSPSGLAAAKFLEQSFGTPWLMACPPEFVAEWKEWSAGRNAFLSLEGKKILIVHQQALANTARSEILSRVKAEITVGSWFMMDENEMAPGDLSFREEREWISHIRAAGYDVVIADPLFRRAVPGCKSIWIDLPHFAVSGKRMPDIG